MNKYNNRKIKVDGYTWDSMKEYQYYLCLKQDKKDGVIYEFDIKPKIVLMDKFELPNGEKVRQICYYPDFIVKKDDKTQIIDVKGFRTNVFDMKWKLLKNKFKEDNNIEFLLI